MADQGLDFEALEKLLGAATPGPWEWVKRKTRPDTIHGPRSGADHLLNVYGTNGDPNGPAIVALRNSAPTLLHLAKEASEMAAALESALDDAEHFNPSGDYTSSRALLARHKAAVGGGR